MKRLNFLPLIATLVLCSSADALHAARGVLHADGRLNVKGNDETGSRVTVMPKDAPSYVLVQGQSRMMLDLELDNSYMVTFEKDGCVTKQLYFDTTVPAEQQGNDFTFPFKVTLESHGRAFTYAGPVGFIRYMYELGDFGYQTDYTANVDESFAERMAVLTRTGSDPMTTTLVPRVVAVSTSGYQRPGELAAEPTVVYFGDRVAPIVREVPRLVQPTSAATMKIPDDIQPVRLNEVLPSIAPPVTEPARAIMAPEKSLSEASIREVLSPTSVPALKPVAAPTGAAMDELTREEEVVVEHRWVTTIIRLKHREGRQEEYRKVVHAWGATFFFKDGLSIPEHMYVSATAF